MQKTKTGISVGLMAALVYSFGIISITPMILLAGYVIVREDDEWLKKSAVKALMIVVIYYIVSGILGLGDNIFAFFNYFLGIIYSNKEKYLYMDYPMSFDSFIINLVSLVKNLLLLILGFKAFTQKSIKLPLVDQFINKHM